MTPRQELIDLAALANISMDGMSRANADAYLAGKFAQVEDAAFEKGRVAGYQAERERNRLVSSRANHTLVAVTQLLPTRASWTVAEIKEKLAAEAIPTKQLYNALGYLVKTGRIERTGYGRYLGAIRALKGAP
jgi:hypothetical protein